MKKTLLISFLFICSHSFSQTISTTGSLVTARCAHESQVLSNGKVLAMGGDNYNLGNFATYKSCELYDPATALWTTAANMNDLRSCFSSILLNNGKVLVMGGIVGEYYSGSGTTYTRKSCEIYDPTTNTWARTDSMQTAREGRFAIKLNNGKVLAAGGGTNLCEIYDPATGQWSSTGAMSSIRVRHTVALLNNGNVLASGGFFSLSSEVYNTTTGTWSASGNMSNTHTFHSATLLGNNNVLITSGGSPDCEIYNPSTNIYTVTGDVFRERNNCPQILLNNGTVLIFGLANIFSPLSTECIEVYNPTSGTWSKTIYNTGTYAGAVNYTIHKLSNNKILIVGGTFTTGNGATNICYLLTQLPVGIYDLDNENSQDIYPNPVLHTIHLPIEVSKGNIEVTIYDMTNKKILTTVISKNQPNIDVSTLTKGPYYLKTADSRLQKFIKL